MKVIETINRGGFGRVEKVRLPNGQVVARKVFDPHPDVARVTDLQKLKKRFKREVKVQASLSSDFFIPVLGFDLDCEHPWFTMPLADRSY